MRPRRYTGRSPGRRRSRRDPAPDLAMLGVGLTSARRISTAKPRARSTAASKSATSNPGGRRCRGFTAGSPMCSCSCRWVSQAWSWRTMRPSGSRAARTPDRLAAPAAEQTPIQRLLSSRLDRDQRLWLQRPGRLIESKLGCASIWCADVVSRDTARPCGHAPRHGRPVHDEHADASTARLAYSARAKARSP